MPSTDQMNPAEIAAQESMAQVLASVEACENFILEAGAGAGKTYSLIKALKHIIKNRGPKLLRENQRVACITYTNVATEEIKSRIDGHPVVFVDTIHSFCWSLLKDFQPALRNALPSVGKWSQRIAEGGIIDNKRIVYELGYPKIEDTQVLLQHEDVLELMVKLLEFPKFRKLLEVRFPIVFIDEYQDTNKEVVESFIKYFIQEKKGPLLGFFGDHWQQIYESTCGSISHPYLKTIDKKANFRSDKNIVHCLNKMRPSLPQHESDPNSSGEVLVYHTNSWVGTRRPPGPGGHWGGDLPAGIPQVYLQNVKSELEQAGWSFDAKYTKVLMLTHNVLSEEQGYKNLASAFDRNESFTKKEDDYIAFFADVFEPAVESYQNKKYGDMFLFLESKRPVLTSHSQKLLWKQSMDRIATIRDNGTIGDMIAHLKSTKLPQLPGKIESKLKKVEEILLKEEADRTEDEKKALTRYNKLMPVQYKEMIALKKYIDDKTPFATKHGVKGAEFENVLVVVGRGWNKYNFDQMLSMIDNIPPDKQTFFERNRNLFYVACSRPKKRLALLFTQQVSDGSLDKLKDIFGTDKIRALPNLQ